MEAPATKTATYIRSHALSGFADIVRGAGGDPVKLVREAGIPAALLDDVDRLVSWPDLCALYELAAHRLNRPNFGMEWSLSIPSHFPNVGPAVLLANFVETLEEWMVASMRYWRNHTNGVMFQLHDDGISEDMCLRFVTNEPSRQAIESTIVQTVRIARFIAGSEDRSPTFVRFRHLEPDEISLHRSFFRCPLEFGCEHNELLFHRDYLKLPINGGLKQRKWLVDFYTRSRIGKITSNNQSIATTTALILRDMLSSGYCSLEFLAASLGLSAKKLQRLLAQEGKSFSSILDNVRKTMALELIVDDKISIARIAGLLDYAGTPPFTLAFRRWTGVSPSQFRQAAWAEERSPPKPRS